MNTYDLKEVREFITAQRKLLYFQNQNLNTMESYIESLPSYEEVMDAVSNNKLKLIEGSVQDNRDMVVRIGDFAEMIKSRGIPYGRNKIHSWLNNRGYTYRENNRNYPKDEYIDEGLFKVRNYIVNRKGGATIESTIYLTSKGVGHFMEEILKEFDMEDFIYEE